MTTSKPTHASYTLTDAALGLCWGAWTELGVSGWNRTHRDWAIDPEPLIIFTAWFSDFDPRLRDESLDWCVHYGRHISKVRLKNLPRGDLDADLLDAWGEYAATVNGRARVTWPGATEPLERYRLTGKSTLRPLTEPSLVCLRMRAMFGLSARTEILRQLLFRPERRLTVAQLARASGYAKRNVADECDTLERAGVLTMRAESNRYYYSLADPKTLADFVGALPSVRPDWSAVLDLVAQLVDLERRTERMSDEVLHVEMHTTMRDIEPDLDVLGFPAPARTADLDYQHIFRPWAERLLSDLAAGEWPTDAEPRPNAERRSGTKTARHHRHT